MTASVSQLFDAFLEHRGRSVTLRTVLRDRAVLESLRTFLDADGPVFLDVAGRPLDRRAGGIGRCDLEDAGIVLAGAEEFLESWLPAAERRGAAHVLRLFALWGQGQGEIGPCEALTLQVLAARHAPAPRRTGRRSPRRRRAS